MRIEATQSFLRQANKLLKRNPSLRVKLKDTIKNLSAEPGTPFLRTHKLTGDLKDFHACSISYEIRLIFKITGDVVELIDIGKHDEVY